MSNYFAKPKSDSTIYLEQLAMKSWSTSCRTHKHLKKIKNNKLREHMGDQKSMNQILRDYRDYIAGADELEQNFFLFGASGFEAVLEIMEEHR